MDVDRAQQRMQLRTALQARGADLTLFEDVAHLDKLWDNCYRSVRALSDATREGLSAAGLSPGLIDHILARKGAAAGLGVAGAAGVAGAGACVPVGSTAGGERLLEGNGWTTREQGSSKTSKKPNNLIVMVSRQRAVEALKAAAASSEEKGKLLFFLHKVPDMELDGWDIEGLDNEVILSFIREAYLKAGAGGAGAAAAAAAGSGDDNSEEYAKQLLQPSLDAPPPLDGLSCFLQEPPAAQIPISADALSLVQLPPNLRAHFTAARGALAYAVGSSLVSPLTPGGSELWTAIAEHVVVVSLLLALDDALQPGLGMGLVAERDQQDSTSLMTVKSQGGSSLRPDGVLRACSGQQMLATWEDKAASMAEAVKDLHKKTAVWTQLYYGNIEYLPCFAAAGNHLQFYAISRVGALAAAPRAVSPRYNLANAKERAHAIMATIKFYQLLRTQLTCYPADVLPAGAVARACGQGFTRELLFRTDTVAVRKRVFPWPAFAAWADVDFVALQRLYRSTVGRPGLVHSMAGTPTLEKDVYSVDIVPVGLPSSNALPATEGDARLLLHGLLHGLAAIHEAGFVHRDLRWDNFACSPGPANSRGWFLLDLETCALADLQPSPGFVPAGWVKGTTLVGGRYTRASDIYQLGLAVLPKCEHVVSTPEGKAFLEALRTPPIDQRASAEQLLKHEWLQCEGVDICTAAGAPPGT